MDPTKRSPNVDDKIIFQTHKHSALVSKKLQSFYQENELFDTVIIAGSDHVNIHAHSVVLCSLSEYFLQIFRRTKRTSKENIVEIKEINASTLKLVIDFMYSGAIELDLRTVEQFLRAASFLKLNTLVDGCCELIEKNIDFNNSLHWFRLAKELSLSSLKNKSLECTYIHFEKISKEKEFMMLNENELKDLFNDNPHGDFEEEVFLSMVAWINYDKPKRELLVFELLSKVRFWVLTPKFIVENRHSVCKTVESYELICGWLQWHLSPETRSNNYSNCTFKPRQKPKLAVVDSFFSHTHKHRSIKIRTFNPKRNSWAEEIEKYIDSKKQDFSAIEIDRKLIMVGGKDNGGWRNTVEYFNLDTFVWGSLSPMINSPKQCCQLVDLKGHLCVFADGEDTDSYSMEIYNFSTCKWQDIYPLSEPSINSQIAAHNGVLYILDFYNGLLQTYEVSTNKWTSRTIKKNSLTNFGLAAIDGFLYVIGGGRYDNDECEESDENHEDNDDEDSDDENNETGYRKIVQRYDLTNDCWCEMASLPYLQLDPFIKTKVLENKIIACDTYNVFEYDLGLDIWTCLTSMPQFCLNNSCDIYNFYR